LRKTILYNKNRGRRKYNETGKRPESINANNIKNKSKGIEIMYGS